MIEFETVPIKNGIVFDGVQTYVLYTRIIYFMYMKRERCNYSEQATDNNIITIFL